MSSTASMELSADGLVRKMVTDAPEDEPQEQQKGEVLCLRCGNFVDKQECQGAGRTKKLWKCNPATHCRGA